MNRNDHRIARQPTADSAPQAVSRPRRNQHRQRDFGIGYGSSSGYGCSRRYASDWTGAPRFRCS